MGRNLTSGRWTALHRRQGGIFFKWWVLLTEVKWYGPSLPSLELSLLLSYPVLVPGAVTISRSILSQGTEINAEVRHGRNALHYAADAGKVPIVRFLLDNMAIIDVRTYFVNTVIWWFWNHDYIMTFTADSFVKSWRKKFAIALWIYLFLF